jgi:hypothetical protein
MAMNKVLMECPYGHDAKGFVLNPDRNEHNRDFVYVQCDECKRVFVHEVAVVSFFSEGNEVEFSRTSFDGGWGEENGTWRGTRIAFKAVEE